ncbi:Protein of unknown function (DUF2970) [Spongiibacter sp. IMCC21906]|jgi:uncharacterized membrane protein|uniref:DUF2970 domain-containing protein n=1 Tax=Spongiibacter sp. IMCC21906 TaxID=1620392 RepID=UPI00062DDB03|nr:DUF2970 domain-containing protein [Spongiibacter sp. IMCC21906]AKH69795.1 Protein of unknown function (DUF2970) [Spongiibacter sp. IMCC21906]
MTETPDKPLQKPPGPFAVIGSVVAAAFGVQSRKNRERDFQHGRFRNYVIAAVLFVVVFIASVTSIVRLVLSQS